jgi:hypothetical protein
MPSVAPKAPRLPFRKGVTPLFSFLGSKSYNYAAGGPSLIEPWNLPRQGYLADVDIYVQGTVTDAATAATLQEDYPFSLTQTLQLLDPAGNAIISETGYGNYVRNLLLGGRPGSNLVNGPASVYAAPNVLSAANAVNFKHRLMIEVNDRDLMGVLPNADPERSYQLAITAAPAASIYTANPPTSIIVPYSPRVKFFSQPPVSDPASGYEFEQTPPHLGAIHKVKYQRVNITGTGAKAISTGLPIGDMYRAIILIFRSNGTRATYAATPFSALRLKYGDNVTRKEYTSEPQLADEMYRYLGYNPPAGVYLLDFTADSGLRPGMDGRRDYFNTSLITELTLEVDLPTGFNTTNSWLEIYTDTLEVPDGMLVL